MTTVRIFIFHDHGADFEVVTPVPAFGTWRIFVVYDHGAYFHTTGRMLIFYDHEACFAFVTAFARPYLLRSSVLSYGPRGVFLYLRTRCM